jgi:hypothetical protein
MPSGERDRLLTDHGLSGMSATPPLARSSGRMSPAPWPDLKGGAPFPRGRRSDPRYPYTEEGPVGTQRDHRQFPAALQPEIGRRPLPDQSCRTSSHYPPSDVRRLPP